jgi:transcriptional regulator with XRE-family HTH domain
MSIRREMRLKLHVNALKRSAKRGLQYMSERSEAISKLGSDVDARASYIRAKLGILVPSKIRALRLKSNMPRQRDLAVRAKMHQSRISMFETPGAANVTLETLARLAAAFKVALVVDFVPFSQMLRWENGYSQDSFDVTRIDNDYEFINPKKTESYSNTLAIPSRLGHNTNVSASTVNLTVVTDKVVENRHSVGTIGMAGGILQPQIQAASGG